MSNDITKLQVLSSLLWKLMERLGAQSIQFIVMIVLARLLLPENFGLIVLLAIFITIAGVIAESGFTTALIQKKNTDEIDFSSVFYLNLFLVNILYVLLFFAAPFIASFFEEPQLILLLRILSLTLFFGAFNSIQHAIIARNMQFKKLFFSSLSAVIISGIIGITLAYAHFGVWALVYQQLSNQLLVTVILWFTVKWRPKLLFSIERLKALFSFGWKLLVSSLIDTLYNNLGSLLIGKIFSPLLLGFYSRGEQFPSFIVSNINGSIQSVMLPVLSSHQENRQRVKEMVRRSIVTSSFIVFPMMVGLAVIAEPLVKVLLTDKWLPAVPFLQIFCAVYALWPIHTANLQAINALGRSDIFLKLEIAKKILGFSILIMSIPFGVHAMALGVFINGFLATFINIHPNLSLLHYGIREQWKDIMPSLLLSLVMGVVVFSIQLYPMPALSTIVFQIVVGVVLYVSLAKLFKLECFTYLLSTLKEMLGSNKKTKIIANNEVQLVMKRLLMLGGSASQVPAIKKAKEMGYYVITCDYLEDNPGHQFADEYHNVSTTDKEAVLALVTFLKIDGIVCYAADSGAPTVAYVAEKLGLPAFPYKSVEILSNKDQFRAFLKENHFNVPQAKGYATLEEAKADFHTFRMPVMIKPVDSSGSRGVSKIDSLDDLQEKVSYALSFSRAERFIIEEFIEKNGYQVGGDCFSVNGKLVFSTLANNHFESKSFNPFLPIGESLPCSMPKRIHKIINEEIQRLLDLLNIQTGPYNFEVQIDNSENVYILDIGLRNAGDLTQVLKYSHGIDLIEYTLKAALGEDCSNLMMGEPNGYWATYLVISEKGGLFKGIKFDDEFKRNNIVEYDQLVKENDLMIDANQKIGTMVLKFSSMTEMLEKMDAMTNWVEVMVEENLVSNVENTN